MHYKDSSINEQLHTITLFHRIKSFALPFIILTNINCTHVTYTNPTKTPTSQTHNITGRFYLAGVIGHTRIHTEMLCPNGVAAIESYFSPGDTALSIITLGIYAPRSYDINCGK